jgi:phosphate/sulfate permease
MRDVSPNPSNEVDLKALIRFLIEFVKQPVQKISQLPDWSWGSLLVVQIALSMASGVLAGLLKFDIWRLAGGIILMPIISTVSALLLSLFIYYYFQFFENKTEDFKKIMTLVVLSSIPFYLFQIISAYFAPISIVGFSFTSLLGVVGLCDNFRVERKKAYKIVGSIFILVVLAWAANKVG